MFTGIIRNIGVIENIDRSAEKYTVSVKTSEEFLSDVKTGDSIAVNGVCLTVVSLAIDVFSVDVMYETTIVTTVERWNSGDRVNLELAMRVNDRIDGHMVQGHIDGIARLKNITKSDNSYVFKFDAYSDFYKMLVKRGSIAIDGVSLTIIHIDDDDFDVSIVPHTYKNTIFQDYPIGREVNIETDIIGKYIAKFVDKS
jgi:riboflavin synthase